MAVGAAQFNGSSDGLSFPNEGAFNGAQKITFSLFVKPISNPFFGYFFGQIGANISGAGNQSGLGLLQSGTDATSLFIAPRNNDNTQEKSDTGLLSTSSFLPVWGVIDGTQGTVSNRARVWVNNSLITFASDSNNFSATLGTCDQPFTVGFGEGTLFNNCIIADLTIRFGVADTSNIFFHASGNSGGFLVNAGDIWIPFLTNFDDVNRVITPTILGSPTIVAGPSINYPGATPIVIASCMPAFLDDYFSSMGY